MHGLALDGAIEMGVVAQAAMEVPPDMAGTVSRVLVEAGDEVQVGQALFMIG